MNGDIQAAARLLEELRKAYRALPKHLQLHVTHLLRERSYLASQGCVFQPKELARFAQ